MRFQNAESLLVKSLDIQKIYNLKFWVDSVFMCRTLLYIHNRRSRLISQLCTFFVGDTKLPQPSISPVGKYRLTYGIEYIYDVLCAWVSFIHLFIFLLIYSLIHSLTHLFIYKKINRIYYLRHWSQKAKKHLSLFSRTHTNQQLCDYF